MFFLQYFRCLLLFREYTLVLFTSYGRYVLTGSLHCVKSVPIRIYSVRLRENADQIDLEYEHFSRSATHSVTTKLFLSTFFFFWDSFSMIFLSVPSSLTSGRHKFLNFFSFSSVQLFFSITNCWQIFFSCSGTEVFIFLRMICLRLRCSTAVSSNAPLGIKTLGCPIEVYFKHFIGKFSNTR